MRQFKLKYYNIDKPEVITRDGRKVRIVCTDGSVMDKDNKLFPVIALVSSNGYGSNGYERVVAYSEDGTCEDNITGLDLFFKPVRHEGWINIVDNGIMMVKDGKIYSSEGQAERFAGNNCIDTIKIEWED